MNNLETLIGELTSGDDRRAEAAVHQIHQHGDAALEPLRELLEAQEPDQRWWATWAIAGIHNQESTRLLREKLKDSDLAVRQCAALGLRQQPDPQAIPDLVACLASEDPTLVHLSAAALAAIGDQAVPVLLELLKNSSLVVRLQILRALGSIGDERAVPALFEALESDSALMEHWANEGLDKLNIGMNFFKP